MRVLIDTNVLISYLLSPRRPGAIRTIVRGFLEEQFTLLLPEDLLQETLKTVRDKPRLAKRISPPELTEFISILEEFGEEIARIEEPIPTITRDPKDDYLLAYALVGKADYLVSGDKDLLVLQGQFSDLSILTPAQFAEMLE